MRVVLDTNILISACLKPEGLEAQVVEMALRLKIQACVTEAVLSEYTEVLRRPKFRNFQGKAESLLAGISLNTVKVIPGEQVKIAIDEDDNRFLECAQAGGAEYLITGNLRHYPAVWGAVRVVNARGFIERSAEPECPKPP